MNIRPPFLFFSFLFFSFSGGYEIQHHERQADEISTFELVKMKCKRRKD
jgi:hypothetical protein